MPVLIEMRQLAQASGRLALSRAVSRGRSSDRTRCPLWMSLVANSPDPAAPASATRACTAMTRLAMLQLDTTRGRSRRAIGRVETDETRREKGWRSRCGIVAGAHVSSFRGPCRCLARPLTCACLLVHRSILFLLSETKTFLNPFLHFSSLHSFSFSLLLHCVLLHQRSHSLH